MTLRAATGGETVISGHAAVFNSLSEDLGYFAPWYERILPGFFAAALRTSDIRALFNHDPNLILARSTIPFGAVGSLSTSEDTIGLAYSFIPTPTTYATDLETNVTAALVTQSSFAFRLSADGYDWIEEDVELPDGSTASVLIRELQPNGCAELYDVSPVTYPAYCQTDVGAEVDDANGDTETNSLRSADAERHDDGSATERVEDGSGTDLHDSENNEALGLTGRSVDAGRLRLRSYGL